MRLGDTGTSVVTDLKPKVPETKGPRSSSVTLLKGSQVVARSQELEGIGELDRWSVVRSVKKVSSWIFGCSVGESNQVFAEDDSSSLQLWFRQLRNCIIFFYLLLQDGEGQRNPRGTSCIKISNESAFCHGQGAHCKIQRTRNNPPISSPLSFKLSPSSALG